jgi:hypothetical protein
VGGEGEILEGEGIIFGFGFGRTAASFGVLSCG